MRDVHGERNFFIKGLDKEGLAYIFLQGAYYVMMDISVDVRMIPLFVNGWQRRWAWQCSGSSFFRENVRHLVRFHFAKRIETLEDALQKLSTLRSKAKRGIS